MEQTAVEFLLEKYKSQNTLLFSDDFEQAKEIDKKRIKNAFDDGFKDNSDYTNPKYRDAEQYYNEPFNASITSSSSSSTICTKSSVTICTKCGKKQF